jgi:hypothetical protein
MGRKSINLVKDDDVQRWKRIKLKEIQRRNNPDLGDTALLREMMSVYEDEVDE